MRLTTAQLEAVKVAYGDLSAMNIDRLADFHELFDQCDDVSLRQLAGAGIRFLSKLAVNACGRRGITL